MAPFKRIKRYTNCTLFGGVLACCILCSISNSTRLDSTRQTQIHLQCLMQTNDIAPTKNIDSTLTVCIFVSIDAMNVPYNHVRLTLSNLRCTCIYVHMQILQLFADIYCSCLRILCTNNTWNSMQSHHIQ